MARLTDYRSDVNNVLASAVDTATWPTTLVDEALRRAVGEFNLLLVYETTFTVVTPGYEQELSSLTDIRSVLAVAYPWQEGWDFAQRLATWRLVGANTIRFTRAVPTAGESVRVRYTKLHTIEDLDGAATTTVPEPQRGLVTLWAAAFACDLRLRQISENPAVPKDAGKQLVQVAAGFRQRAQEAVSHLAPLGRVQWVSMGLE